MDGLLTVSSGNRLIISVIIAIAVVAVVAVILLAQTSWEVISPITVT